MKHLVRAGVVLGALAGALLPAGHAHGQDDLAALRTAYNSGRYDDVVDALEGRARRDAGVAELRLLIDTQLEIGAYDEALAVAEHGVERLGDELAYRHGRSLLALGRRSEAEAAFRRSMEARASDALSARLWRGVVEMQTGRVEAALDRFDSFIDVYNGRPGLTAEDLVAVAIACTYLGRRDPQLFQDAVRAFDEAIEADLDSVEARLRLGELFLDKYDSTEAAGLIGEVMALNPNHPRAWLAEARRQQFDGESGTAEALARALALNPRLVAAHVFGGVQRLMVEDTEGAIAAARTALAIDEGDLQAQALLAAAHYIDGDSAAFERVVARALEVNPAAGELFVTAAEMAVYNRLYTDAVALATRATRLAPDLAAAWGTLGINQLRIGEIEEGRRSLERAFEGDPYNVWFKNTLDLLDTFPGYETVRTENFDLFIEQERADLLGLYMGPLAEEAFAALVERYGSRPEGRIRVEVYSRHADFSVRTVGLAGIGALGVAFGPVVAVDAPATPGMGEFNWGATLWHEIAHVVTLGATSNRIPRWLTEGLSVFEERRARPGWGDEVDPGFVMAWLEDRLHPVSRINDGFVRPAYPGHVGHSYLQASLVCEMIAERFGFDSIPAMLAAYRRGLDTPEVFQSVFGVEPDGLDETFRDWFETRYETRLEALRPSVAANPEPGPDGARQPPSFAELQSRAQSNSRDYVAQLAAGRALMEQGRAEEALEFLERARELFPEHAGPDSSYPLLAHAYEDAGRIVEAVETLRDMTARYAGSAAAWEQLAQLEEGRGRWAQAAEALQQLVWIDPASIELQRRVAGLWERAGNWPAVVRARQAVVALAPVDRAEALYELARAHVATGDSRGARRAVLGALEIAPGYADAQELLLRLRGEREETR